MTDDSTTIVTTAESYAFAFRLGSVGCIILTLLALVGPALAALTALAGWTLATMFLFPWIYTAWTNWESRDFPP